MNPAEFLHTAQDLTNGTRESDYRSSISRSYYAVFLSLREFLDQNGLKKTKSPNLQAHEFVEQCLEWCEIKAGIKVATILNQLKKHRKFSDYDLHIAISQQDSSDVFQKAHKAISDFSIAVSEMPDDDLGMLIENAKKYAEKKDWLLPS